MRARTRPWALVAGALCAGALSGGCGVGWANTTAIRSPNTVSRNLQDAVLDTVDRYGLPVVYDYVGCHGPDAGGHVTCYAETAETPTGAIVASFTLHRRRASSCPGPLAVTMNGSTLATVTVDPCR